MSRIDPHRSWLPLEEAAERAPNDRQRGLLTEVRNHMEAEIKGRIEPLMATLTAEPIYHFWGRGDPMVLEGADAVRGFYLGMFATGGQQFEVVLDNIVANDQFVVTEGQVKTLSTGASLLAGGMSDVRGTPIEAGSLWLANAQLVTVWPADDAGKLVGEDIYFGQDPMATLQPITADELPDYYVLPAQA